MKRTPYTHPSLQARKPMRAYNPDRQARLFERAFHSDEFVRWLKRHRCIVPGCDRANIEVMHVRSRGAGGDWTDTVPACAPHHRESHDLGIGTFQTKHGLDLPALALETAARWLNEQGEG